MNDLFEFVPIPGFENEYAINKAGNVKSLERDVVYKNGRVHRLKEKILTPFFSPERGYNFTFSKQRKTFLSRLLALTFLPNPNGYARVGRLDGDLKNNNLDNLYWTSDRKHPKTGDDRKPYTHKQPTWRDLSEEELKQIIDDYIPLKFGYLKIAKKYKLCYEQTRSILKNMRKPLKNKLPLFTWDYSILVNDNYSDPNYVPKIEEDEDCR